MILLFSITNDQTTTEVIRWLNKFSFTDIVRLNADEPNYKFHSYRNSKILVEYCGSLIDLQSNIVSWYRKGKLLFTKNVDISEIDDFFSDGGEFVKGNIYGDLRVLSSFFYELIEEQGYSLGFNYNSSINKLTTMKLAEAVGLNVPNSHIITSESSLLEILDKEESVITKSVSDGVYLFHKGMAHYSYTEKISRENIEDLPEAFFPSLVQNLVEKEYEVRSFYLEGEFFSMAIFSQNDDQTSVDFRKYNTANPNRTVPYILPRKEEEKLIQLFKKLGLNTGSVDLIKDINGNYIFLEINPVGQFSMVSYPCNYYLEKKVSQLLYNKWKNLSSTNLKSKSQTVENFHSTTIS